MAGAAAALLLAWLVYALDRPLGTTQLLPGLGVPAGAGSAGFGAFGPFGGWLPSLLHPLAFSLLSAWALGRQGRQAWGLCALWWGLNIAMEFTQHPRLAAPLCTALESVFGAGGGPASPLVRFMRHGTFDGGDLAAATLGALVAAAMLSLPRRPEEPHA